ncbi:MAG: dynamin family protein [Bacteroidetes bacterium]|jgi:ribosome biogenesis GTPase A|nr:dynamin family protein [Bacteroidota bacterium]
MNQIINQEVYAFRSRLEELAKEIHHLTIIVNHDELAETVSSLRNRINEPYMFVIVGEVKAGKSSFINALLDTGKEITKVAPQPMTDTIQQIVYGEQEEVIVINPFLKKITQPIDILKEVAIVDTPGTNTIIEKHQQITEEFIPSSDLIVFVFESKNPYRQSAWDFLEYIKDDWKKKVIFVLQQKDLMDAADLRVNIDGVVNQAEKKGMSRPLVFAVSAKMEQEGNKAESGFGEIRNFISHNITGGKAPYLKLENILVTLNNIQHRIGVSLEVRKKQYELDTAFRHDVTESLDQHETRSKKHVDLLVENILNAYDQATGRAVSELNHGLSFPVMLKRSFTSIFSKKSTLKAWLESVANQLSDDLNNGLRNKLADGVSDVAESIQQMAKIIQLKVQNSQTILKNDQDIFSDIAERRNYIMTDLQNTFNQFLEKSDNFKDQSLFPDQSGVSANIATGSGLAVVGIILAAVTHGAVFDITGGVLTAVGLLFASITTMVKKNKIMTNFNAEIRKGKEKLATEVDSQIKLYIAHLRKRIEDNFIRFDEMLVQEEKQIALIDNDFDKLSVKLGSADHDLKKILIKL